MMSLAKYSLKVYLIILTKMYVVGLLMAVTLLIVAGVPDTLTCVFVIYKTDNPFLRGSKCCNLTRGCC